MGKLLRFQSTTARPFYMNEYKNGDFSLGLSNWNINQTWSNNTYTENGILHFTPLVNTTSATDQHVRQPFSYVIGRKYYMCAYVKGHTSLYIYWVNQSDATNTSTNNWRWMATIRTSTVSGYRNCGLKPHPTLAYPDGYNVEYQCKYFGFIDLTTQFGAGNEPTLSWCNANIRPYIVWKGVI